MENWKRSSIERRKSIYAKEWGVKNRDHLVTSWYAGSKIWRKIEDNRVSNKKLLVARNYIGCWKIYKGMWSMLNNEKQDRGTNKKDNGK